MVEYKSIPTYEGLYEAGDDGTIWSCCGKTTFRVLKNGKRQKRIWQRRKIKQKQEQRTRSKKCDYRVDLWKNGEHKTWLVHRLVALTFIPNPYFRPCVNHIDGNPANNHVENLEWCTYSENQHHAYLNDLNHEHTWTTLISSVNGFKKTFVSMAEASRWLGMNNGYISGLLSRGITRVGEYEIKLGKN